MLYYTIDSKWRKMDILVIKVGDNMYDCEEYCNDHYYIKINKETIIEISQALTTLLSFEYKEIINKNIYWFTEKIKLELDMKEEAFQRELLFFDCKGKPYKGEINFSKNNANVFMVFKKIKDLLSTQELSSIQQLSQGSLQAMAIYDAVTLRLIYANGKYLHALEALDDPSKVLGKPLINPESPFIDNTLKFLKERLIKQGKVFQKQSFIEVSENPNTYRNISLTPIKVNGEVEYIVSTIEKDSNKGKSDDEAKALYWIINSLDIPIINLEYPSLNILAINNGARELLDRHFNIDDCLSIYEFIEKFAVEECSGLVLELRNIKEGRYYKNVRVKNQDGYKTFNIFCQPYKNTEGDISDIVVIILDITEEVNQRDKIENLLRAQEEFFSYISHEFKTPVTVTLSAIQVLEFTAKEGLNPLTKKYVNKIRQSSFQQLRLVYNLLDITRADSGYLKINRKRIDLVEITSLIIDSIELYSRERNIEIIFNSSKGSIFTALDDEKYERILLNLLSNAIKFSASGKKIYVDLYTKEKEAVIAVRDEGIGIPKEKLQYIFERYTQINNNLVRSSEGTGIGLCLAKLMAKALGGDIKVYSELGKGATFEVYLPLEGVMAQDIEAPREMDLLDDRLMRSIRIEFSDLETS